MAGDRVGVRAEAKDDVVGACVEPVVFAAERMPAVGEPSVRGVVIRRHSVVDHVEGGAAAAMVARAGEVLLVLEPEHDVSVGAHPDPRFAEASEEVADDHARFGGVQAPRVKRGDRPEDEAMPESNGAVLRLRLEGIRFVVGLGPVAGVKREVLRFGKEDCPPCSVIHQGPKLAVIRNQPDGSNRVRVPVK